MSSATSIFDAMRAARSELIPVIMAPEEILEKQIIHPDVLEKLLARRKSLAAAPEPQVTAAAEPTSHIVGDSEGEETGGRGRGSSSSSSSSTSSSGGGSSGNESDDDGPGPAEPAEAAFGLGGEFLQLGGARRKLAGKRARDGDEVGASSIPPWAEERFAASPRGYCPTNAAVALHDEVSDFVEYLRPTEQEITMRRLVELQIADIARSLWPHCTPVVYGSMSTHLLLPSSDIDMSVLDVPDDVVTALHKLSRGISQQELCTSTFPQVITGAKVPIVKFTHRLAKVEVDVSINAGDGKRNSDIICGLLTQLPEAAPLTMVVKHFLQQRGLNEPYKGGMGSFATTLMVCSFLQQHPIYHHDAALRPHYGLGRLLVDIFRYYGQLFNFQRVGLSLDRGGECFIKGPGSVDAGTGRPPPPVLIEDPGMPSNNAASSLRHFHSIAIGFSWAYQALTSPIDPALRDGDYRTREVQRRPTLLSRIVHLDDELLRRREIMEEAHDAWLAATSPAVVLRTTRYKRDEDAPMLRGTKPVRCLARVPSGSPAASAPPSRRSGTRTREAAPKQQRAERPAEGDRRRSGRVPGDEGGRRGRRSTSGGSRSSAAAPLPPRSSDQRSQRSQQLPPPPPPPRAKGRYRIPQSDDDSDDGLPLQRY